MQKKVLPLFWLAGILLFCRCGVLESTKTAYILSESKFDRKPQSASSIQGIYRSNDTLIINFTATLNKQEKNVPCHIKFPIDSMLARYNNKLWYTVELDTAMVQKFKTKYWSRVPSNIWNNGLAAGAEFGCSYKMLERGFYPGTAAQLQERDTVRILKGVKEMAFTADYKNRSVYHGKHIVFLYHPHQPLAAMNSMVDYLVLNIEPFPVWDNRRRRKLPVAVLIDIISFPFLIMLSGMEK